MSTWSRLSIAMWLQPGVRPTHWYLQPIENLNCWWTITIANMVSENESIILCFGWNTNSKLQWIYLNCISWLGNPSDWNNTLWAWPEQSTYKSWPVSTRSSKIDPSLFASGLWNLCLYKQHEAIQFWGCWRFLQIVGTFWKHLEKRSPAGAKLLNWTPALIREASQLMMRT